MDEQAAGQFDKACEHFKRGELTLKELEEAGLLFQLANDSLDTTRGCKCPDGPTHPGYCEG